MQCFHSQMGSYYGVRKSQDIRGCDSAGRVKFEIISVKGSMKSTLMVYPLRLCCSANTKMTV